MTPFKPDLKPDLKLNLRQSLTNAWAAGSGASWPDTPEEDRDRRLLSVRFRGRHTIVKLINPYPDDPRPPYQWNKCPSCHRNCRKPAGCSSWLKFGKCYIPGSRAKI